MPDANLLLNATEYRKLTKKYFERKSAGIINSKKFGSSRRQSDDRK